MSKPKHNLPSDRATPSKRSTERGATDIAQPRFAGGANSTSGPKGVMPLRDRCWVSVDEASQVTGEGRTRIHELIALGKSLTKKVGRRRLVSVRSLLEYCAE